MLLRNIQQMGRPNQILMSERTLWEWINSVENRGFFIVASSKPHDVNSVFITESMNNWTFTSQIDPHFHQFMPVWKIRWIICSQNIYKKLQKKITKKITKARSSRVVRKPARKFVTFLHQKIIANTLVVSVLANINLYLNLAVTILNFLNLVVTILNFGRHGALKRTILDVIYVA